MSRGFGFFSRIRGFFRPAVTSLGLLTARSRRRYWFIVGLRVFSNALDVAAISGVALFALMVAARLGGNTDTLTNRFFSISLEDSHTFLLVLTLVIAVFLFKSALATALLRLNGQFLAKVEAGVAAEIVQFAFGSSLSHLQKFSFSRVQYAMSSSTSIAFSGLLTHLNVLLTEGTLFVLVLSAFLFVNPLAALVIFAYFGLLVVVFQIFASKRLKTAGADLAISSKIATQRVLDLSKAFKELRVLGKSDRYTDDFRAHRLIEARSFARMRFFEGFPRFYVESAMMVGVGLMMLFFVSQDRISEGLSTTAVFLAGGFRLMGAMLPFQSAVVWMRAQAPQAKDSHELLQLARGDMAQKNERSTSRNPRPSIMANLSHVDDFPPPEIEIANISFAYPDSPRKALDSISLTIPRGEFLAFVGPSGAGKTTLVDVLLGLLEPSQGRVFFDGRSPSSFLSSRPGSIGYVPQKPAIVTGTIAENIAIGVPEEEIDFDRVNYLVDLLDLRQSIELRNGLSTELGGQADVLSGGQAQRLGLARAMYPAPSLLVLDEATSALDAGTEARIVNYLETFRGKITVIVIAHRLSTVKNADRVAVIDDGVLVAAGKFAELKKTNELVINYVELMSLDD